MRAVGLGVMAREAWAVLYVTRATKKAPVSCTGASTDGLAVLGLPLPGGRHALSGPNAHLSPLVVICV